MRHICVYRIHLLPYIHSFVHCVYMCYVCLQHSYVYNILHAMSSTVYACVCLWRLKTRIRISSKQKKPATFLRVKHTIRFIWCKLSRLQYSSHLHSKIKIRIMFSLIDALSLIKPFAFLFSGTHAESFFLFCPCVFDCV